MSAAAKDYGAIVFVRAAAGEAGHARRLGLGLQVRLEGNRVHLYYGSARLVDPEEITQRLRYDLDETRRAHIADLERLLRVTPRDEAGAKARADAEVALARLRALLAETTTGDKSG